MRPSALSHHLFFSGRVLLCGLGIVGGTAFGRVARAQTAASPAGTEAPAHAAAPVATVETPPSPHAVHEAEAAFLKGARAMDRKDLTEAETQFARALQLNPRNRDYSIALAVAREHRLTALVQAAAHERQQGHEEAANRLLLEAREIDPQNEVVRQHFAADGSIANASPAPPEDMTGAAARGRDALTLAGPLPLQPSSARQSFHLHAPADQLLQQVSAAFGLRQRVVGDIHSGAVLRFDLENASWPEALRALQALTNTFGAPLQPHELLFVADTPENRAQYLPLIEETLYMPGTSQTDLLEYAAMARSVFNLRVVNAVNTAGSLVLRGDQDTLSRVNATFAELVDGGADVELDLSLYEVDKSHVDNLGAQLPSSIGIFPVASTAQNLINQNQSVIAEAVANNLITLTGNSYTDALTELEFLIGSGAVSSTQFSNLLGVFVHYGGLPLAGTFLGSTTQLNALLTSSEVRLLDTVKLRVGDKQDGQFRAGTRYPIETGLYTSSLPSSLASAVAGLNINGTSVSSLLSQYTGASSVSVPQVQYEDLGLTLKATPQVLRAGEVQVKLDLKVEALGSGTINSIPILNNRQLTSTVIIGRGQTAMLASQVSTSELRAITGLPFLSEIPGFDSTNKDTERDSTELMITLTPHIVRNKNVHIASQRLLMANESKGNSQ